MEDSHGKDISLQCTTVKVPGMKPRGSRVVSAATTASSSEGGISSELDAMHIVSTPGGASTNNSSSSVNSAGTAVTANTPGRPPNVALPKDKV